MFVKKPIVYIYIFTSFKVTAAHAHVACFLYSSTRLPLCGSTRLPLCGSTRLPLCVPATLFLSKSARHYMTSHSSTKLWLRPSLPRDEMNHYNNNIIIIMNNYRYNDVLHNSLTNQVTMAILPTMHFGLMYVNIWLIYPYVGTYLNDTHDTLLRHVCVC